MRYADGNLNYIPERIRLLMRLHEINQKQFAERTGITKSEVTMILKGQRNVTGSTILKICNAFDISCDYLLGRTSRPSGRL